MSFLHDAIAKLDPSRADPGTECVKNTDARHPGASTGRLRHATNWDARAKLFAQAGLDAVMPVRRSPAIKCVLGGMYHPFG